MKMLNKKKTVVQQCRKGRVDKSFFKAVPDSSAERVGLAVTINATLSG